MFFMANRKVFHDSIVPIPVDAGPAPGGLMVNTAAATDHLNENLTLHFSLGLHPDVEQELEKRVAKGEVVGENELHDRYGADQHDADALVGWLKSNGFTIEEVTPDRTSVYASAPADAIAKALQVQMARVTLGGFTYTAARNAPSLPEDVGAPVQAIVGLQPFRQLNKHFRRRPLPKSTRVAAAAGVEFAAVGVAAGAPALPPQPPYTPAEILQAYEGDRLNLTGRGQTIAILIDAFPDDADLTEFWAQAGVPGSLARIQKVNVGGGAVPPPEGEETLDVEWASGIAPDATIRVYATGSLSFVDLDRALDRILADIPQIPSMRQLSISLGLGETFLNGPGGEVAIEHQKFLKLAAAGVNVFVSTGDAGSNPDQTGHSSGGPLQAEYQSSDPFVIAVGGTTLHIGPDGSTASEIGWANGGGGKSIYFAKPDWQTGAGISGTRRLVPDVSAAADPEQGALIVLHGRPQQIGGTSWSAPVWAGFCALINESRVTNGKPPIAFLNPAIYPLAGSNAFRDIVSGSNGAFHAIPGFDLVTGLGVPRLRALVQALSGGATHT
jgi:kumamolisin